MFKIKTRKKGRRETGSESLRLDLHVSGDIKNIMKDHLEQFSEIIHEVLKAVKGKKEDKN